MPMAAPSPEIMGIGNWMVVACHMPIPAHQFNAPTELVPEWYNDGHRATGTGHRSGGTASNNLPKALAIASRSLRATGSSRPRVTRPPTSASRISNGITRNLSWRRSRDRRILIAAGDGARADFGVRISRDDFAAFAASSLTIRVRTASRCIASAFFVTGERTALCACS
jgi:hypothetical protein